MSKFSALPNEFMAEGRASQEQAERESALWKTIAEMS